MLKFFRNRRYPLLSSTRTNRFSVENFLLNPQPSKTVISDEWESLNLGHFDDESSSLKLSDVVAVERRRDIVSVILDLEDRPFTIGDYKLFVFADFYHRWNQMIEKDSLLSIVTLEHGTKHIKSFDPDGFEDIPDYLNMKLDTIKDQITRLNVPIGSVHDQYRKGSPYWIMDKMNREKRPA